MLRGLPLPGSSMVTSCSCEVRCSGWRKSPTMGSCMDCESVEAMVVSQKPCPKHSRLLPRKKVLSKLSYPHHSFKLHNTKG